MPKDARSGGSQERTRWNMEGVEPPRAVTADDFIPSCHILYREAKRIKFDGTVIIGGKTMDRNQILNNVGRHQNIVKNKIATRERKSV